jgi:hypothetical protein
MSQGDTNDNENVIARLVLNEVKELDEAIQRDCFPFASLWALAHIARNDRKRVWLFLREIFTLYKIDIPYELSGIIQVPLSTYMGKYNLTYGFKSNVNPDITIFSL